MRWFGGHVTNTPAAPFPRPHGARLLTESPHPVWTVGEWSGRETTHASAHGREAIIFGVHAVPSQAVASWLRDFHAPPAWPGCYTVVVCDPDEITVFTDPAHAVPIYCTELGGGLVWGSSSRALAALAGSRINPAWVAGAISRPISFRPERQSAFSGVNAIAPGHRVTLRPGRRPRSRPWWRIPRLLPAREAAWGLRSALEDAVAARTAIAQHLSCDLSGGLDSTTLCLLAADHARPPARVTALTVRPAAVDSGGDLDYARAIVRERGDISHVLLPLGTGCDPYAALREIGPTDEPAPTTITYARHRAAYQTLSSIGSRHHITGDGGDALLIPPPSALTGPMSQGPHHYLRHFVNEYGRAKLNRTSPWSHLRGLIMPPPEQPPAWVTRRAQDLTAIGADKGDDGEDTGTLAEIRTTARTAQADTQIAAAWGIRLDAPFFDRAVIEAALRFHPVDRGSPWNYKPQITVAMADVLPALVRRRHTKGDTTADHYRGLRHHLTETRDLTEGWLAGHGLIDTQRLNAALGNGATGLPAPFGSVEAAIAAEVWARAVTAATPIAWTYSTAQPGNFNGRLRHRP
ncbi:albusnodin/ikarugamycin family macrolactam cyclase [Streptomonospora sp. S1-112]|uniref:Albusnodin/ikarugamycin family macrolactam cyclase n=1 Tax=Streptomonospora mangrovi TaxID=2883123 RepID=A0A9X3NN28_9ACTN|nr:albusnodin/ikarugamycin family macrolactam cyclase [Streptomonospora mangrovi]MDA0566764.1 albusnodin/ikarugamycin family macrolactam cyclase [Streptomonospora mangrovi]